MKQLLITQATPKDRKEIYRIRYQVYTLELGQHEITSQEYLTDALDDYNEYLVCKDGDAIAGFISITPPGRRFSLDKYRQRDTLSFLYENSYEVRILTVRPAYRGRKLANRLLSAAAAYVKDNGGSLIIGIGRKELMGYYKKCGFIAIDEVYQSGKVQFQLMFTMPDELRDRIAAQDDTG